MIAGLQAALADAAFQRVEDLRVFLDPALIGPPLIRIVVVMLASYVGYRLIRILIRRLVDREIDETDPVLRRLREQRGKTLGSLLGSVAGIVITTIAALTILASFIDIGPILASVGVLGLAVSFGAQSLVKDVITGVFMLLEGQFAVGDVVRISDVSGAVEKVTLRTVVLRDLYGVVHIIPNGEITRVSNLTKTFSRAVLDIGVAYSEDVDRVIEVMGEVGAELAADEPWRTRLTGEPPRVLGVESLADSAVVIRMVVDTLPQQQFDVTRELRRRMKKRFDAEGIEIPFPHVTFYWGDGQRPDAARSGAPLPAS